MIAIWGEVDTVCGSIAWEDLNLPWGVQCGWLEQWVFF